MKPNLDELVRALPDDVDDAPPARRALDELMAGLAHRPVPTGRLPRLWALGSMQARVAAGYVAWWLKSRFADDDEKARLASEAHLAAGLKLVAGMGYLRGAISKVGQTLAGYPNLVPGELAAILETLHFEAPPMHWALVREHLHDQWGAPPDEVFEEFETEAFAAASLGQVHRARLADGQRVAVKIQYPGIARTIESDFANMRALMATMRFRRDWRAVRDQWGDVQDTLLREADYGYELEALEEARRALVDEEDVVLPRAHPDLCTPRVLVTELLDGDHLRPFMATGPSQELCNLHGKRILRATTRLFLANRALHADLGPGNFLFLRDGRLGMLDFGCYRRLDAEEWEYMELAFRAVFEGDPLYTEVLRRGALLSDKDLANEERMAAMNRYVDWCWEPYRHEGELAFDDAHVQEGLDALTGTMRAGLMKAIPANTWIWRQTYSMRGLLHGLGARFDAKSVHDGELARAGLAS